MTTGESSDPEDSFALLKVVIMETCYVAIADERMEAISSPARHWARCTGIGAHYG
jgi:hypothetical protein